MAKVPASFNLDYYSSVPILSLQSIVYSIHCAVHCAVHCTVLCMIYRLDCAVHKTFKKCTVLA